MAVWTARRDRLGAHVAHGDGRAGDATVICGWLLIPPSSSSPSAIGRRSSNARPDSHPNPRKAPSSPARPETNGRAGGHELFLQESRTPAGRGAAGKRAEVQTRASCSAPAACNFPPAAGSTQRRKGGMRCAVWDAWTRRLVGGGPCKVRNAGTAASFSPVAAEDLGRCRARRYLRTCAGLVNSLCCFNRRVLGGTNGGPGAEVTMPPWDRDSGEVIVCGLHMGRC